MKDLSLPWGIYSNIRVVPKHFRGACVHRVAWGEQRERVPLVQDGGGGSVSIAGQSQSEARPPQPQGPPRPPGEGPWVGPSSA